MSRAIVPPSFDRWRMVKLASSVAALALLVVAVPIVLVDIGGVPFSHTGVGQISRSLTSTHPGNPRLVTGWIAGAALVLAWLAWAWMTVCVVVELRSWATGRTPMRLPASRTVQSVVACLVGTALAMSAVGRPVPSPKQRTATGARAVPLRSVELAGSPMSAASYGSPQSTGLTDLSDLSGADVVPIALLLGTTGASGPSRASGPTRAPENDYGSGDRNGTSSGARVPGPSPSGSPSSVAVVAPETEHEGPSMSSTRPLISRAEVDGWGRVGGEPTSETSDCSPAGLVRVDPPVVPRTHLVRPRETLWSIAEDELGTALRWHELAEYNYGISQADGRSLDEGHWVVPGWRLLLPPAIGSATGNRTADAVVGIPAPSAQDPAASTPPGLPVFPVPAATDSLSLGRSEAPDRAHLALSDLVTPPTSPTSPTSPTPPTSHTTTRAAEPVTPVTPIRPTVPVVPLGGGVVGAGVVRLLDRLRRVQQRHRPEGGYIRLPDRDGRRFEQRLRVGDGWSIAHEVDVAIRWAVESAPVSTAESAAAPTSQATPAPVLSESVPQVLGVRIHPEVIELVLAEETRRAMVVDRSELPSGAGSPADRRAVAPMLATVGQGAVGPVMVNLESLGSLVVSGNPDEADAVVRALALELATSYWAGQFSVAVVGFGSELDRFEGVTSHADVADLVHALYRRRIDGTELLRSTGYPSFADARRAEASERWDPLVVICGPAVSEADVVELLDIGSDPDLGTAVVAVGERIEAQYSVRLTGDTWAASLELLGAVAFPQRIDPHEWDQVTALLDTAATRESVLSSEEPYVNLPVRLPGRVDEALPVPSEPTLRTVPAAATADPAVWAESVLLSGPATHRRTGPARPGDAAADVDADTDSDSNSDGATDAQADAATHTGVDRDVVVAVLGPIEIRGAARPFTRAWAEELVVYLAMHSNGASNEAWATALWPDRLMAPSSLHSTASVARRSLGQSADGTDYLPRSHGRLALAPTVGTDWDRFVGLAGSDRPEQWRAALMLVRGRPFAGLRSSDWPILEGIAPAIEAAVVDLSGRLAGRYLRQGNAQGAEWSARRGLVVSPYDERLYRMLMRAADAGGNPAGVDSVMAELLRLVADDIEPLDAVHPSTMDLYRQLSRRRKVPSPRS